MDTTDKDVPTTEETAEMVELEQIERDKAAKAKEPRSEDDPKAD